MQFVATFSLAGNFPDILDVKVYVSAKARWVACTIEGGNGVAL